MNERGRPGIEASLLPQLPVCLYSDTDLGQRFHFNMAFHVALRLTMELAERCRDLLLRHYSDSGDLGDGGDQGEGGEERGTRGQREGVNGDPQTGSAAEEAPIMGSEDAAVAENITFDLCSLSEEQLVCLDDVSVLLPAMRVWAEWLAAQEDLWCPLLSPQNKSDL